MRLVSHEIYGATHIVEVALTNDECKVWGDQIKDEAAFDEAFGRAALALAGVDGKPSDVSMIFSTPHEICTGEDANVNYFSVQHCEQQGASTQ